MNTCPVFRRSGGHSYDATVPGPIGSVLAPAKDARRYASLPFASSLCGSCTDVCPVKIDLHHQLLLWRQELGKQRLTPLSKRVASRVVSFVLGRRRLYELLGWFSRVLGRMLPRPLLHIRLNPWARQRELPPMPRESFRAQWRKRRV